METQKTVFLSVVLGVLLVLHGAESLHLKVNDTEQLLLHYCDYFDSFWYKVLKDWNYEILILNLAIDHAYITTFVMISDYTDSYISDSLESLVVIISTCTV